MGDRLDKFFIISLAISVTGHSFLVGNLPVFGARSVKPTTDIGIEFSYISLIDRQLEELDPGGTSFRPEEEASVSIEKGERGDKLATKEILRGTGETFEGEVLESLSPVFSEGSEMSPECMEAIKKYKSRLEQILAREGRLFYPSSAKLAGQEAKLNLRFCIKSDGSLESFEIPSSSGDFGAVIVLGLRRAAAQFPPFPEEIKTEKLTFCWPVNFDLY